MSQKLEAFSSEDRMVREYQVTGFACRNLAQWALAHFGDRTDPHAYTRLVISLSNTGQDVAIHKIYQDLKNCGFTYREEAVWRMYERYRLEGERHYPSALTFAA